VLEEFAALCGRQQCAVGVEVLLVAEVQVAVGVEVFGCRSAVVEAEVGAPLRVVAPAVGEVDGGPVAAQEGPVERRAVGDAAFGVVGSGSDPYTGTAEQQWAQFRATRAR